MAYDPIRLVETHPDSTEPFIALSHRWGPTKHATTTVANYAQRRKSIAMSELSKTFQDAVWLTRRLRIRYLWIDSFCILQGDTEDWKREAATMPRLYTAAYLTIAAAHGIDGAAGIFYEGQALPRVLEVKDSTTGDRGLNQEITGPTKVLITPGTRQPEKDSLVHRLYGSDDKITEPSVSHESLLSRAWAFQERVLSTRIVHFTHEEMVWECNASRRCECGRLNGVSFLTSLVGSIRRKFDDSHESNGESDYESDDERRSDSSSSSLGADHRHSMLFPKLKGVLSYPESIWWTFVRYYTTRQLTVLTDRGPAFRGIATMFGRIMRDSEADKGLGKHCSGLWQPHLPRDLLWSQTPTQARRIPDSTEPSWSWYSVSGLCQLAEDALGLYLGRQKKLDGFKTTYNHEQGSLTLSYGYLSMVTRSSPSDAFKLRERYQQSESPTKHLVTLIADDPDEGRGILETFCLRLAHGVHPVWARLPSVDSEMLDDLPDEAYEPHECGHHVVGEPSSPPLFPAAAPTGALDYST